jgi:hypothetical protein
MPERGEVSLANLNPRRRLQLLFRGTANPRPAHPLLACPRLARIGAPFTCEAMVAPVSLSGSRCHLVSSVCPLEAGIVNPGVFAAGAFTAGTVVKTEVAGVLADIGSTPEAGAVTPSADAGSTVIREGAPNAIGQTASTLVITSSPSSTVTCPNDSPNVTGPLTSDGTLY